MGDATPLYSVRRGMEGAPFPFNSIKSTLKYLTFVEHKVLGSKT